MTHNPPLRFRLRELCALHAMTGDDLYKSYVKEVLGEKAGTRTPRKSQDTIRRWDTGFNFLRRGGDYTRPPDLRDTLILLNIFKCSFWDLIEFI